MKSRNILVISRNVSIKNKVSVQFQRYGFNTLCTDMNLFDMQMLDLFMPRLVAIDHPDRLPSGSYLVSHLKAMLPPPTLVLITDSRRPSAPFVDPAFSHQIDVNLDSDELKKAVFNCLYPQGVVPTKRRDDRVHVQCPVFWRLTDERPPSQGTAIDLTYQGAQIRAPSHSLPRPGDVIEFSFEENEDENPFGLRSVALVRWVKGTNAQMGEFGMQFIATTDPTTEFIEGLMFSRSS